MRLARGHPAAADSRPNPRPLPAGFSRGKLAWEARGIGNSRLGPRPLPPVPLPLLSRPRRVDGTGARSAARSAELHTRRTVLTTEAGVEVDVRRDSGATGKLELAPESGQLEPLLPDLLPMRAVAAKRLVLGVAPRVLRTLVLSAVALGSWDCASALGAGSHHHRVSSPSTISSPTRSPA